MIGEGITTVCGEAFAYCANLKTVRLPFSLADIDDGAFPASCTSLTDVYYNGLQIDWEGGWILPWGYNENDAIYGAHMHYRETAPAGEDYPVTADGVSSVFDGEALTADADGYYTARNNDTVLFSFSAPDMPGYTLSYRFLNISWWDMLPKPSSGAGVTDYESRLTVWGGGDLAVTVTAMAVYAPADPAGPILTASLDFDFHLIGQDAGITVSGPVTLNPGDDYPVSITIPETTETAGAEWNIECYKGDEFCFGASSYESEDPLETGTTVFRFSGDLMTEPGVYDLGFSFNGIGYAPYGRVIRFAVIDMRLPEDLETIRDEAFAGGSFHAVYVPDGCTYIGHGAFANCSELEFISYPSGAEVMPDAFGNHVVTEIR